MKRNIVVILIVVALAVFAVISLLPPENPRGHLIVTTADWHSAAELVTPGP